MIMRARIWLLCTIFALAACSAPDINDWPPAPLKVSDEVVQQYVDRYALKETSPRIYTDTELKALQILQERRQYQKSSSIRQSSKDTEEEIPSSKERSRAEINAIKRRVYRRYESAHDRRHELKSKYGL